MSSPELSRMVELRSVHGQMLRIEASPAERTALAGRFGIVAIHRLTADVQLDRHGPGAQVTGRLDANIVQACAISGEDLAQTLTEELNLRFIPATGTHRPDEEIELSEADCDEIEFSGGRFDVGEAVAQSLALAIDPFATGPEADRARAEAGLLDEQAAGPFAALAKLKKGD
ncbi:MAG: DUF177 domain-containing protein [Novosphingobium sp.]|nr:DUF177 domain-containing protein [Novosphingobium sp.]